MIMKFRPNWSRNVLHTLNPEGANGTSKFMETGGRVHFFLLSVCKSSISAEIWDSFMPAIRFILEKVILDEIAGVTSTIKL